MTAIDTALNEALSAGQAAFGEPVTVGGVAATGIVTGVSIDSQFVEGGIGEAGGKSLTLTKSAFPTQPTKSTLCVVRGQTLRIVSVMDRLRHWYCSLGDLSAR